MASLCLKFISPDEYNATKYCYAMQQSNTQSGV